MNSKRMVVLGNLLIMGLVFWMVASIVLTWISQRRSAGFFKGVAQETPSSRELVPRQNKTLEHYAAVSEKDVFRASKAPASTPLTEEADVEVTQLNLELKGTVVGEGRNSYAVIVDHDSGKEEVYFQDDFILGARITKVMKSKVILESNGRVEALLMTDQSRAIPELGSSSKTRPQQRSRPPVRRVITPRRGAPTLGQ